MREPHTIIERIERRSIRISVCTVISLNTSRFKAPGILDIHLKTVTVQRIVRPETINHIKVLTGVGYDVACRVSHLILARLLLHMLHLIGQGSLNVMLLCRMARHQLDALNISLEIIACMLEIGSHAKVLRRLRLIEPILSLYVVPLFFVRLES